MCINLKTIYNNFLENRKKKKALANTKSYMGKYGLNLQCPHCQKWAEESNENIWDNIQSFDHPMALAYDCLLCGKPSFWVCEAGFWFSAEEFFKRDTKELAEQYRKFKNHIKE